MLPSSPTNDTITALTMLSRNQRTMLPMLRTIFASTMDRQVGHSNGGYICRDFPFVACEGANLVPLFLGSWRTLDWHAPGRRIRQSRQSPRLPLKSYPLFFRAEVMRRDCLTSKLDVFLHDGIFLDPARMSGEQDNPAVGHRFVVPRGRGVTSVDGSGWESDPPGAASATPQRL